MGGKSGKGSLVLSRAKDLSGREEKKIDRMEEVGNKSSQFLRGLMEQKRGSSRNILFEVKSAKEGQPTKKTWCCQDWNFRQFFLRRSFYKRRQAMGKYRPKRGGRGTEASPEDLFLKRGGRYVQKVIALSRGGESQALQRAERECLHKGSQRKLVRNQR